MSQKLLSVVVARRAAVSLRSSYHASAMQLAGAHYPPPVPPFARSPPRKEPMTENSDAVWDDGVAPELALDFDAPNVSTREALYTWVGAFGAFYVLYKMISFVRNDNQIDNPALSHATDVVVPDYADLDKVPLEK